MTIRTTALQQLRTPNPDEDPDIPGDLANLADDVDKRLGAVYNSAADRDSRNTSPQEGQFAYLKDTDKLYVYTTTWTQIWPPTGIPTFTSGSGAPSSASGTTGDVYFQI